MGQTCSRSEAFHLLSDQLGLPAKLLDSGFDDTQKIHTFTGLTTKKWLQKVNLRGKIPKDFELLNCSKKESTLAKIFQPSFIFEEESSFLKVLIHVFNKDVKVICNENGIIPTTSDTSLFDLLEAANTRDAKKFSQFKSSFQENASELQYENTILNWNDVQKLLKQFYNINTVKLNDPNCNGEMNNNYTASYCTQFIPIYTVCESLDTVFIIEELLPHSLLDVLKYSPSLLHKNHSSVMFLFYQFTQICSELKQIGFSLSDKLSLDNVRLSHNSLWLNLSPFQCVNLNYDMETVELKSPIIEIYKGPDTNLKQLPVLEEHLNVYTSKWCDGNVSTFDYLIILNQLVGRKFGDPLNHPVFPWITDFSCYYGGFRNLNKTKFRLNKGDRQLDATFSAGIGSFSNTPIQHHVSDVLSDITYYIYHARKTPKDILCSHVRSRWVPDEYPASIGRMYSWTPDECIPEFFYDASIFKSMHSDLRDLGFPEFISTPEEFVVYHKELLESNYVSKNLHHWIDLIFGYKLSGSAAKHEKNVHLSLVDEHKDLKNYGILQLFSTPHPKRKYFMKNKDLPDGMLDTSSVQSRDVSASWEYVDITSSIRKSKEDCLTQMDQDDFLNRKSAKSFIANNNATTPSEDDVIVPTVYDVTLNIGDFTCLDNLEDVEEVLMHELCIMQADSDGVGRFKFGSAFENKVEDPCFLNLNLIDNDTKIMACLLMEIILHKQLRLRTKLPDLDERLQENLKFLNSTNDVPSAAKYFIEDLLGLKEQLVDTMKSSPSSSLFQEVHSLKFSPYFKNIYLFLNHLYSVIYQHKKNVLTNDDKWNLSNDIEECVPALQYLLEELHTDSMDLLLLYLIPLFESTNLQIPMYLHFFAPLSTALGPERSKHLFIKELQRIYDSVKSIDEVALLQQPFLSKALSSFGPEVFLNTLLNFILDVLLGDNVSLVSGQQPLTREISTLSASLSAGYKSESLMSYEVSPCYLDEKDSVSSLNLDNIFNDATQHTILSHEYTQSFADDRNSVSLCNLLDSIDGDDIQDTCLLKSPSAVIIDSTSFPKLNDLPVLSSQEVHSASGFESMIEIDTTNESLETFSLHHGIPSEDSNYTDSKKSKDNAAPFTVFLSNTNMPIQHSLEEAEEVLEEVPNDEDFVVNEGASSTPLNINAYQSVSESIKWLIPWLGPVLTTECVATPLLRKLSKVFLEVTDTEETVDSVDCLIEKTSSIIECLIEVALIYGDNIVLELYLPYVGQLIEHAISGSSVSISLGSNLVTSVQLIMESCKLLQPESILSHIEEFSCNFFQPLIRLLSTVKPFSTGGIVKEFLSRKLIDILGMLCQKLKREVAQEIMAPLLQQFFSCFDGIYTLRKHMTGSFVTRKYSLLCQTLDQKGSQEKKKLNIASSAPTGRKFSGFDEIDQSPYKGRLARIQSLSIDDVLKDDEELETNSIHDEQFADIYDTFSPALAYHAYVLFCRVMGTLYIEKTLYNCDLIWHLFTKHDECLTTSSNEGKSDCSNETNPDTGDSGKKVENKWKQPLKFTQEEERYYSERSTWQYIDGKWYEHWKNSQGIHEQQQQLLEFSDLKLQTYAGHSSAIRDFYVSDNEHYFLSASRDKTVKLWLLKNHGNGTAHLGCSRTYDEHSRAVFAVQGIESKRVVASCDGNVHIWDPVTGTRLGEFDAGRGNTITSIRTLPAPSTCLAVATTEGLLRIYDVRQKKFAQEWKLSPQLSSGMVRSMCTNPEGTWIATGLSSGITAVLDLHFGLLKSQTRVHDGEIIHMVGIQGNGFVSASVDYNLRLWHEDGNVSHILKSSNESIHTVMYDKHQLVWATSNNKLCIHQKGKLQSLQPYRISPDSFKGSLSKMALLPTNRLYLFGADNGNVVLYA